MGWLQSKEKALGEFYKNQVIEPGIWDMGHRQFRLNLGNRFRVVPRRIATGQVLSRIVASYRPRDVYYSVGRWIEPHRVPPRYRARKIQDNLFLGCDLAFDIDVRPFSVASIEKARRICCTLLEYAESRGWQQHYIAFSGGKGFHVLCHDPTSYSAENPYEREKEAKRYRKGVARNMENEGIEIDSTVTVDTRRIIRVPGTINFSTGYQCRRLQAGEIRKPAAEILKNTFRLSYSTLRTFGDDQLTLSMLQHIRAAVRGRVSPPPILYSTFLSNTVLGIRDRAVPFFTYRKENPVRVQELLQTVQQRYGLGNIYLFQSGGEIGALSADSLPLPRLAKVLRAGRSEGYGKLLRYRCNWLRIGAQVDAEGRPWRSEPRLVARLPARGRHTQSAGHLLFLQQRAGETNDGIFNKHGVEEYKIIDAMVKD